MMPFEFVEEDFYSEVTCFFSPEYVVHACQWQIVILFPICGIEVQFVFSDFFCLFAFLWVIFLCLNCEKAYF